MRRKSLVLLIGLALVFVGSVAPSTALDPPDTSIDSDDDGLSDSWEAVVGTNPTDSDSDDDGIIDGGDPDILVALSLIHI